MKATRATVKSFIRNNFENLFINVRSSFDGMTDCCEEQRGGFQRAVKEEDEFYSNHTLGVRGAWFVGQSRDYITPFNENGFIGFSICNACGRFILAIRNN